MACSSAVPKFSVRRRPAVLVAPAAPTPRELKRLSDIDEIDFVRNQIPVIQFYRRNESMGGKDPARVIREALAKALVPYYPFAGRLREHDGWKHAVDCTGEGVLFVEADADVGIEHFGDPLLPPFSCLEELIFDVPGSSAILNTPLLLFQVTRLACGGFILGVRLNHTMADGVGLVQFLGAVAELARGAQSPSVLPVWKRELLEGRNQQQTGLAYDKLDEVPNTGGDTDTMASSIMLPFDTAVHRLHNFFFGPREIAAIRAQLPPDLQQRATKFDTIAGWIWKFRTVALAPEPNKVMQLIVGVSARGRNTSGLGLPIGYYGNAVAFPAAISTAGELCTNPLSYAVELVKKAKNKVDMEYMRSRANVIALHRGQSPPFNSGMYNLVDETKVRFHSLDFGWGKPVYAGPAEVVIAPFPVLWSFLLASKNTNGEDGIVVPICLPGPAMDRLVEEMSNCTLQPK
ncbi:benzyl alcohol O-benzoyltransferase-like [Panicum virgatum]|nr:benzyl alcohol O-benzoyltransferase-like [Panicum virgatum]